MSLTNTALFDVDSTLIPFVIPCCKIQDEHKVFPDCKHLLQENWGTRWRSWLRHYAASRKVAGSIPHSAIRIFHL
jgi:hypothetical protein